MSDINEKFGKNRQKFRKVYNYGMTRQPDVRPFVDAITNTTRSVDFQKYIRDRDYFVIDGYYQHIQPAPDPAPVQFLEVTAGFSVTDSVFINFPTEMTGSPIVAIRPVQDTFTNDGEVGNNLAWWITDVSVNGFRAHFSAPFRGSITYMATYTDDFSNFPLYVERKPDHPGQFGYVSANSMSVSNQTAVTMSWNGLTTLPDFLNYNPVGVVDDNLDVAQVITFVTNSQAVNVFSSDFTGVLHVVAMDTGPDTSPFTADPDPAIPGVG